MGLMRQANKPMVPTASGNLAEPAQRSGWSHIGQPLDVSADALAQGARRYGIRRGGGRRTAGGHRAAGRPEGRSAGTRRTGSGAMADASCDACREARPR